VAKSAIVEEGATSYAWVVDVRGRVQKRTVEAVVTGADRAKVKAGLAIGETVILSPPKTLREGEEVKVSD